MPEGEKEARRSLIRRLARALDLPRAVSTSWARRDAKTHKIRRRTVTRNEAGPLYIAVTRERDNERMGGKKTKDDDIFRVRR